MTGLKLGVAAAALFALSTLAAEAQNGTVTGAAGGAVTGAIVGGPVGAAVGGVTGAIAGTVLDPPAEVRQYVLQEQIPSVKVQDQVAVGQSLPQTVEIHTIPQHDTYAYAVVNDQRLIVDPKTRKVVEVVQ